MVHPYLNKAGFNVYLLALDFAEVTSISLDALVEALVHIIVSADFKLHFVINHPFIRS